MTDDSVATTGRTVPPLTPAGRRVLDAASGLFYREGIHAVGVDAIAAAAGVTKKTLYACFGSKDRLVAAYLAERDDRWRDWLTSWVREHAPAPAERLPATLDALAHWLDREAPRGCAFVNALAELPSPDHPGHAVVVAQKRWMLDYFTGLAADAGHPDPDKAAAGFMLLHEGVSTVAGTGVLPDAAGHAHRMAAGLLTA
ncbi:TetR/AcrR family transcriptional regulator [Nocardiopsis ansamitocini]|uniref:TetR family transcriptional regulator n=1 Tax=Nocardiopsis ansamitocini TaxID=1670832 RepID=A0A9W6UIJ3_9ACTN|nr:TetR/AcrR family transcriptional regulator [Nocardiopsis ansamitocini]GLU49996.1 TetR family transcriptional regulator [Nocardiopsis ansamitocini]